MGGSGVLVNLAVFVLVLSVWGLLTGEPPSVAGLVSRETGHAARRGAFVANALGFAVSLLSNYFLNRRWTFRSTRPVAGEISKFVTVSLIAYAGQLAAFWVALTQLHLGRAPSQLLAIACVMPINFAANKLWSFR